MAKKQRQLLYVHNDQAQPSNQLHALALDAIGRSLSDGGIRSPFAEWG